MISLEPKKMQGTIEIPASKSQTIRAFLIALAAEGESVIRHPLISSDTVSCIEAIKKFGAEVEFNEDKSIAIVRSQGLKLSESITIDAGNSGTTTYLLLPMAASLSVPVTITGDEQMKKRPTGPLKEAVIAMGAKAVDHDGKPPVTVQGPLKGGHVSIECRTSQYLSGLLLASPLAEGKTVIDCPVLYEKPYVTITLSWLDNQNIDYSISSDYLISSVKGRQCYKAGAFMVSGDYSSASFFFALAAMKRQSITVLGLDRLDAQGDKRVLEILKVMGCQVKWIDNGVMVTGTEHLKGGVFDINDIPDALPILSALALFAEEDVTLTNVPQARIKETDRIRAMHDELRKIGADIIEEEDGLIIKSGAKLHGAEVKGYKDHRIIMTFAILSTMVDGIHIDDTKHVDVTFPTFFTLLKEVLKEIDR